MMEERFLREGMLLGEPALISLKNSHVAVIGLGGVGSWCCEALARSGIGTITVIDSDTYSTSNINRQLCALESTVGMPKSDAIAARLKDINPDISVHSIYAPYEKSLISGFDYVADCIDMVSAKIDLISTCISLGIPIISSMGTGNKKDLQKLQVTDISKTINDPLSRVMRKELRAKGINHLKVVYSPEESMECAQCETPPPGRRSVPGSLVWVPAAAGLLMAQEIVLSL